MSLGITRSVWARPRITPPPLPAPAPAPIRIDPRAMPPVIAKAPSTAYYNPSRIIDRSRLKIVDSIAAERQKEFAEERGDAVAPINGGGISASRNFIDIGAEKVPDTPNIAKLLIPAIVAYFLFGG